MSYATKHNKELDKWAEEAHKQRVSYGKLQTKETCILLGHSHYYYDLEKEIKEKIFAK